MILKDDNVLVNEVVKGDIASFGILVDRYQQTIFTMVFRMLGDMETAKDLTQDVFVKAYEKLHCFNPKYKFFSWIYRIAINETINWIKRNPCRETLEEIQSVPATEDDTEIKERHSCLLNKALLELSPDTRSLLILKYYAGLSYESLSEVQGVPIKTVKSRLYEAREHLRSKLINFGYLCND